MSFNLRLNKKIAYYSIFSFSIFVIIYLLIVSYNIIPDFHNKIEILENRVDSLKNVIKKYDRKYFVTTEKRDSIISILFNKDKDSISLEDYDNMIINLNNEVTSSYNKIRKLGEEIDSLNKIIVSEKSKYKIASVDTIVKKNDYYDNKNYYTSIKNRLATTDTLISKKDLYQNNNKINILPGDTAISKRDYYSLINLSNTYSNKKIGYIIAGTYDVLFNKGIIQGRSNFNNVILSPNYEVLVKKYNSKIIDFTNINSFPLALQFNEYKFKELISSQNIEKESYSIINNGLNIYDAGKFFNKSKYIVIITEKN